MQYLLDDGQNPGLCIVVSVGANAQVDLVGVLVATEGGHEAEERVFGRLGDDTRVESGSSHWIDVGGNLGEACLGRGLGVRGRVWHDYGVGALPRLRFTAAAAAA
jgi:hypothetical protein